MIRVEGLTKRYGDTVVVDDVSFTVERGEGVALWGPNGAGKSTIMRCLLGSIPFEGSVTIGGHDVVRRGKAARRLIGYVPQHLSFYDDRRSLRRWRCRPSCDARMRIAATSCSNGSASRSTGRRRSVRSRVG